jgi:hypothetical protein
MVEKVTRKGLKYLRFYVGCGNLMELGCLAVVIIHREITAGGIETAHCLRRTW